MLKILLINLLYLFIFSSCSLGLSEDEIREKIKHESEASDRLNRSQKDTESLFKEID